MNKYQKAAAKDLLKIFAAGVAGALIVNIALAFLTLGQFVTIIAVGLLAYTGKTLFSMLVAQYEYKDKLNEMVDKK